MKFLMARFKGIWKGKKVHPVSSKAAVKSGSEAVEPSKVESGQESATVPGKGVGRVEPITVQAARENVEPACPVPQPRTGRRRSDSLRAQNRTPLYRVHQSSAYSHHYTTTFAVGLLAIGVVTTLHVARPPREQREQGGGGRGQCETQLNNS